MFPGCHPRRGQPRSESTRLVGWISFAACLLRTFPVAVLGAEWNLVRGPVIASQPSIRILSHRYLGRNAERFEICSRWRSVATPPESVPHTGVHPGGVLPSLHRYRTSFSEPMVSSIPHLHGCTDVVESGAGYERSRIRYSFVRFITTNSFPPRSLLLSVPSITSSSLMNLFVTI